MLGKQTTSSFSQLISPQQNSNARIERLFYQNTVLEGPCSQTQGSIISTQPGNLLSMSCAFMFVYAVCLWGAIDCQNVSFISVVCLLYVWVMLNRSRNTQPTKTMTSHEEAVIKRGQLKKHNVKQCINCIWSFCFMTVATGNSSITVFVFLLL